MLRADTPRSRHSDSEPPATAVVGDRPRHRRCARRGARAWRQRARPAGGHRQEHGPPHVRRARRPWPARSHCDGGYRLGLALRRVRQPGHGPHRRRRPRPAAARRAAQHARRDGADRRAGRCRRRLRRAGRGPPGAALLDERPPLTDPSLKRREGARRLRSKDGRRPPAGRPAAEHRIHDRRARTVPRRAGYRPPARLRHERRRDRARHVVDRRASRAPLDGPVVAAISMVGPTVRVVGDHETHHTGVLQAAAIRLGNSIETGEYQLRPRRR